MLYQKQTKSFHTMDIQTLEQANQLHKKIKSLETALSVFEWEDGTPRNPRLILEFDNGCEIETQYIPMDLSNDLITLLKSEISKKIEAAKSEFKAL